MGLPRAPIAYGRIPPGKFDRMYSQINRAVSTYLMSEQEMIEAINEVLLMRLTAIEFDKKIGQQTEDGKHSNVCSICDTPFPFFGNYTCLRCNRWLTGTQDHEEFRKKLFALIDKFSNNANLKEKARLLANEDYLKIVNQPGLVEVSQTESHSHLKSEAELELKKITDFMQYEIGKVRKKEKLDPKRDINELDYWGMYEKIDADGALKYQAERDRLWAKFKKELVKSKEVKSYVEKYSNGCLFLKINLVCGDSYHFHWNNEKLVEDEIDRVNKTGDQWNYGWQSFFEIGRELDKLEKSRIRGHTHMRFPEQQTTTSESEPRNKCHVKFHLGGTPPYPHTP
jgi:hypothetical protein